MARQETDFNRGTFWYNGKGWCNWGWFEDTILNTHFGFITNKEGTLQTKHRSYIRSFSTNTKVDSNGLHSIVSMDPSTCRFSSDHLYTISKDIILPGKHYSLPSEEVISTFNTKSQTEQEYEALRVFHSAIDEYFEDFKHPDKNRGIIRNFVFSADYLIKHFSAGVRSLESALNSFWSRVSSTYGGYWNFEIVQSQNTNGRIGVIDNFVTENRVQSVSCFPVIDNKSTPKNPKKNFEFSVYSLNSLMSEFSVDVSLDSKMVTQAVYHTNKDIVATGNSGMNMPEYLSIKALSTLNNAIITEDEIDNLGNEVKAQDAILTEVTTPYLKGLYTYAKGSTYGPLRLKGFREISEVNKQIEVAVENANKRIKERDARHAYEEGAWWPKDTSKSKLLIYKSDGEMFKQLKKGMLFHLNKSVNSTLEIDPIVPVSVSFTINGIGGIRIGDCFAIDYLPEVYRQYSVFQVSKVSHTVGTTGWTTSIDGLLRVSINELNKFAKTKEVEEDKTTLILNKIFNMTMLKANDAYETTGEGSLGRDKKLIDRIKNSGPVTLVDLKELEDDIYDTLRNDTKMAYDDNEPNWQGTVPMTNYGEYQIKYDQHGGTVTFTKIDKDGKTRKVTGGKLHKELQEKVYYAGDVRKDIFTKENFPDLGTNKNGKERIKGLSKARKFYTMPLDISSAESIFRTSK